MEPKLYIQIGTGKMDQEGNDKVIAKNIPYAKLSNTVAQAIDELVNIWGY